MTEQNELVTDPRTDFLYQEIERLHRIIKKSDADWIALRREVAAMRGALDLAEAMRLEFTTDSKSLREIAAEGRFVAALKALPSLREEEREAEV